jgi:small subunit ribosomal protein S20
MPVTKSAKQALRTAERRHQENLKLKSAYKQAVKQVKKAAVAGAEGISALISTAQSALDTAAKRKTIHPNKAARLKSRLAKRVVAEATALATPATEVKKVNTPKKVVGKTNAAKSAATKNAAAKAATQKEAAAKKVADKAEKKVAAKKA